MIKHNLKNMLYTEDFCVLISTVYGIPYILDVNGYGYGYTCGEGYGFGDGYGYGEEDGDGYGDGEDYENGLELYD